MAAFGQNHQTAEDQPAHLPFTPAERHHHASAMIHTAWAGWDYETAPGAAGNHVGNSEDE